MMLRSLLALTLLAGLAAPSAILAPSAHAQRAAEAVFNELEKRLIRDFFRAGATGQTGTAAAKAKSGKKGKSGEMPPGLAKKESLPPGLEKQLQRNGTLPPGLAKRDLPSGLEARLPKRMGQKRLIVGNDVVLIERATGLILDILENVLSQ